MNLTMLTYSGAHERSPTMTMSVCMLGAIIATLAASPARSQSTEAEFPFADLLPATTAVCFWSDRTQELAERWRKTSFYELYTAESMRPFWNAVRQKRGGLLPSERLGIDWEDLEEVAAGRWAVTYDVHPSAPGTLLVVEIAGRDDVAVSVLARVQKRWKERGLNVQVRKYSGCEYAAGTGATETRFALIDHGCLCVTDQWRLVQHVVGVRRSAKGTLFASLPCAAAIRGAAKPAPEGSVRFFVDPWLLARSTVHASAGESDSRVALLERHGFTAIQALVGYVVFHEGKNDAEFTVAVPVRFPLSDAAQMLTFLPTADLIPAPLVPANSVAVACFQWDIRRAFQAYGFVYDDLYGEDYQGAFDDLLRALAEDSEGPQVDVQADFIDLLRGKVTHCSDFGGALTDANPSGRREFWMAETSDADRAAAAMQKFFDNDPDVTMTPINGVQIWHSRADTPWWRSESDNPLQITVDAFCILRGHLIVASDRKALQALAADEHPSWTLGDKLFKSGPRDVSRIARSWRNLAEVGRSVHARLAKNKPPASGAWEEWLLGYLLSTKSKDGVWEWDIDSSQLPAFSDIQDLFGVELIEVSGNEHGWQLDGRLVRGVGK